MSKKLMVALALVLSISAVGVLGSSQVARAHFAIEDPVTGLKSTFHATPDHSPIAGKKSIISYDFSKSEHESNAFRYSLTIKKAREKEVAVLSTLNRNVLLAEYVFPSQGLYTLTLTVTPKDSSAKPSVLTYNQRVSRGDMAETSGFGKFEAGVFAVVFGAIGIVFVMTYKDIPMKDKKGKK